MLENQEIKMQIILENQDIKQAQNVGISLKKTSKKFQKTEKENNKQKKR